MIHTDRSRQETGLQECLRARYWRYHAVDGFGIVRKGTHIYMQTGLAVHEVIGKLLQAIMLSGVDPKTIKFDLKSKARLQVRKFIAQSLAHYRKMVEDAGWLGPEGDEKWGPGERQTWLEEQCCLVEGLVWGWVKTSLPKILKEFKVINAEREESYVVGCSCGLGDGNEHEPDAHEKLDCGGVNQQSRPDMILQRLSDLAVGIHDHKTMADIGESQVSKFRNSTQMAVGTVGVERRLGVPVTHYYVHAFKRGKRAASYVRETKKFEGPKMQQSDFCYVTYHPSNAPLRPEELVTTTGKWYEKTPVWEIEFESKPDGLSNIEWLVELLPEDEVAANYVLIGPYDRQGFIIKNHLRQIEAHENWWADAQWNIYVKNVEEGRSLDEVLAEEVPASWNCNNWGRMCDYWPICSGDLPLEEIMNSELYEPRIPHHVFERAAQLTAQGQKFELPVFVQDGELLKPANAKVASILRRVQRAQKTERK